MPIACGLIEESLFSNIADMEFVFRVNLDFRHRLIVGGIEGRHHRFWRAEFPEVAASVGQAEVVDVGRPVAPGLPVRLGSGGNGGLQEGLLVEYMPSWSSRSNAGLWRTSASGNPAV